MGVMGITLISPVLPALRPVFGVSDPQVGLLITLYTLPGIFLTPIIGVLADRLGRKRVLVPLLFTFGIAGAGIAFTTDFTVVLALRFFQGFGASALVMLSITLIGDIYEGETRRTIIGINGSMISTGAAFYPLIGGALAVIYWGVPFLLYGVGIIVGILAIVVLEEPTIDDPISTEQYFSRMFAAAKVPEALAIFGAMLGLFFIFYGAVITVLPLLLSDEFGLSSGEIGVVLAMVSVASAIISSQYGRVSRVRSVHQLIALGFIAYGVSLIGVYMAPNALLIGVSLLLFGLGIGVVMPSIDTALIALVSEELRAGMMGLRTSLIRLGQTLGPVGFTFTADTFFPTTVAGYQTLLFISGVFLIVSGTAAYAIVSRN